MLVVTALGGNALLPSGEPIEAEIQRRNIGFALDALAPLAAEHSVVVIHSDGPQLDLQMIRTQINADEVVICGGIPPTVDERGALHGVEAVVDKDRSAALLARELGADALLLLTDVPYVERHYGTERAHPIREASVRELDLAEFADGSMRPKLQAACRFASETGKIAAIGALADASAILAGLAGTHIVAAPVDRAWRSRAVSDARLTSRSGVHRRRHGPT